MHYEREFTIGSREVQELYLGQALHNGAKGIVGFAVVGALVAILYKPSWAREDPKLAAAFAVGVGLVTLLVLTLCVAISTKGQIKKVVSRFEAKAYKQKILLDGFGVHVTVGDKTADCGFGKLLRVKESKKAFYIFVTEKDAWILPKAQMDDPQEESRQIRELFRTVMMNSQLKLMK